MKPRFWKDKPWLRTVGEAAGCGLLSFALSAGKIGALYAPFALGAVGAAGGRSRGVGAMLGTLLGALVFFDFQPGLRLAASAVLIYSTNLALYDTKLYARGDFRPVNSALMLLLVQSVYLIGRGLTHWALCAVAAVMAALSAQVLGGRRYAQAHRLLVLLGAMAVAAVPVQLDGFSLGCTVALWLTLLVAQSAPPLSAGLVGAAIGFSVDLSAAQPMLLFAAVCAAAGCLGALYRKRGRWATALLFSAAAFIVYAAMDGDYPSRLALEALCAACAFLLMPRLWLEDIARQIAADAPPAAPEAVAAAAVNAPLKAGADAFRELYSLLFAAPEPEKPENPAVLFDRAAEQVCRSCVLSKNCWQTEYTATYNAFNDACPALLQRGKALPTDFPPHFAARCLHMPELLHAINTELYAFLLRQQYRRRLGAARTLAELQFAQMGETLEGTSPVEQREIWPLRCRVGTALRPKEGQTRCGDQLAAFSAGGTLYLLLSDGMGSGEKAHDEAAMTVRLLRQFLKAGIDAPPALKTLNAALTLHCQEGGAFTTIDLLAMDRRTGEASLYKYGASPSYLRRGDTLTRLTAESLPAGLESAAAAPETVHVHLEPGSLLVMVSDGVTGGGDEAWLSELLRTWQGGTSQELATLILSESRRRGGLRDDCAALVLQLEKNTENMAERV